MPNSRSPSALRGFTIIETLLVISVLFIILPMLGVIVARATEATSAATRVVDSTRAADLALQTVADDVRAAKQWTAGPRSFDRLAVTEAVPDDDVIMVFALGDGRRVAYRADDEAERVCRIVLDADGSVRSDAALPGRIAELRLVPEKDFPRLVRIELDYLLPPHADAGDISGYPRRGTLRTAAAMRVEDDHAR